MKKSILITIIALSTLFSCSKKDDKEPKISNENAETLMHDGITREYILHVPEIYDGSVQVPLMLNFHGYGGIASEYMGWADMRPVADTENFILVYPQGTLLDGSPHWNAGLDTPDNKSDADDFGFVEALLNEISANYNIDSERVYVCGYSNGAFFSYALACFYSDKIAAVGSVAGTMLEETYDYCVPSHPTPMINIHGTSDGVVAYNGGVGLKPINAVLMYWINFNNANTTPITNSTNDNGTTIEHHTYTNGDNGIFVEHYKVIDGNHVWFDMNYEGANTGRLIWNYMSRYDINGLR